MMVNAFFNEYWIGLSLDGDVKQHMQGTWEGDHFKQLHLPGSMSHYFPQRETSEEHYKPSHYCSRLNTTYSIWCTLHMDQLALDHAQVVMAITIDVIVSGGYRGGPGGPWPPPPHKPMSGRMTSCSRRKDKRIMVSSHKEPKVANA